MVGSAKIKEKMFLNHTVGVCTSRPVRARGLKLALAHKDIEVIIVAPRTGAWIET